MLPSHHSTLLSVNMSPDFAVTLGVPDSLLHSSVGFGGWDS